MSEVRKSNIFHRAADKIVCKRVFNRDVGVMRKVGGRSFFNDKFGVGQSCETGNYKAARFDGVGQTVYRRRVRSVSDIVRVE